jgi:hypothetical protein
VRRPQAAPLAPPIDADDPTASRERPCVHPLDMDRWTCPAGYSAAERQSCERSRTTSRRRYRTPATKRCGSLNRILAPSDDDHARASAPIGAARARSPLAVAAPRGCQYPIAIRGERFAPTCRRMRGCSSMVEQQPSKLMTRVRFPSPAPIPTVNVARGISLDRRRPVSPAPGAPYARLQHIRDNPTVGGP